MCLAYLWSRSAVGSLLHFCPNLTCAAGCCLLYGGRFDPATSGGPRHEGFGLHRRFEITMYDIVVVWQDMTYNLSPCLQVILYCIYDVHVRDRLKGWWRILHVRSDTLQYLEIQLVHVCLRAKLGMQCDINYCLLLLVIMIFHCPGSHLDYMVLFDSNLFLFFLGPTACQKRYQAIPLSSKHIKTIGSRKHSVPKRGPSSPQVFLCAMMSTASRPHVACIRLEPIIWTGNREQRQLQFDIVYISDFCITKSCVHAPNTVKRYSELRKTIPMSHRAPWLLLSLACRSCAKQHFGLIRQWSSLH